MSIKRITPINKKWGYLSIFRCMSIVVMLITASNLFAQAHFGTIDGLRYLIDENEKTATLVANPYEKYSGDIIVPEKVEAKNGEGYLITAFGDNCFKDCEELNFVMIPSSVTSLGDSCFRCGEQLECLYFEGKLPDNINNSGIPYTCKL